MRSRRIIYLAMLVVVAIPIICKFTLRPVQMPSADRMYSVIDSIAMKEGEVAMVWMDFGPNTIAENQPQAEVLLEHLFRRRIPTIVISQYVQADTFLKSIPRTIAKRLEAEFPDQKWKYGDDWINAGYKAGATLFMQGLGKSTNISEMLAKDVHGAEFSSFPRFAHIGGLESIRLVGEITGLVGTFDSVVQFLQKDGYRPLLVHGCTSITIPEAYIFLDSGQLNGLLEGIAGAAWYSQRLGNVNKGRKPDTSLVRSTALSVAQLAILFLIVIGNFGTFVAWFRGNYA